jgi:integrase/recombinase XerD
VSDLALRERVQGGGELIDDLEARALDIAAAAAAPNTRRAYATAYRAFTRFLRTRYGEASTQTLTLAAVTAWRDELQAQGLAASTVALRVSAVRSLAMAVGADPLVHQVRCTQVQRQRPRALSGRELARLLAAPDLRTVIGMRDRAILVLLARAGLRRSELARLTLSDVQESGREPDKRSRAAIATKRADQTTLEVVVRGTTRARARSVPLHAQAHAALSRWYAVRPAAGSDALFVSLRNRPSARPEALSAGAVSDIVAKHAAASSVRRDRRTAHALRHTFCTLLAQRGVALQVIKELAGHVDIRTTEIYLDVTEQRKADDSAARKRSPHPRAA